MTKTSQNHVFERDCFKKSGSFGIFYYGLCFSLRAFMQVLKKNGLHCSLAPYFRGVCP